MFKKIILLGLLFSINSSAAQITTKFINDGAVTNVKVATGLDAAKISTGVISNTEFEFLNGVTSDIQTQFTGKASTTLDNLGTTSLNAGIIPSTTDARDLGTINVAFRRMHSNEFRMQIGTVYYGGFTGNATSPTGSANQVHIFSNQPNRDLILHTVNNTGTTTNMALETGNSSTLLSGNIRLQSGTAGTGSGNISLITGTAGTLRGSIVLTAFSVDMSGLSTATLILPKTITAGGTTGNQTIDKISGSVNFAATATTLTVTNSTVTTNSIVHATASTNDTTCYVKNVVPAAGSFVINMVAACTAETSVRFTVFN